MEIVFESTDQSRRRLIPILKLVEIHTLQMNEIDIIHRMEHDDREEPNGKTNSREFSLQNVKYHYRKTKFKIIEDTNE